MRIEFAELFGLSEVKWVNEKLLFMRPWWDRIAATDLIYDVEAEKIIYAKSVTDANLAYQQFRESCPVQGLNASRRRRSDGVLSSDSCNTPSLKYSMTPGIPLHRDGLAAVDHQGVAGDEGCFVGN